MMRFLIDEQLPAGLVGRLESEGLAAVHVGSLLGFGASDEAVARETEKLQAILITKDADFIHRSVGGNFSRPVVWVRLGNMNNQALWTVLRPALPQILKELKEGARVVQVV